MSSEEGDYESEGAQDLGANSPTSESAALPISEVEDQLSAINCAEIFGVGEHHASRSRSAPALLFEWASRPRALHGLYWPTSTWSSRHFVARKALVERGGKWPKTVWTRIGSGGIH